MVPSQEANGDNLGVFFFFFSIFDEAILMSTYNIQFHDKIRTFP